MTNISNIVGGINSLSDQRLHFNDARKNVKKLLIEGVKVAAGIGGFIAVSRLMARQNSSLSAAGVGALAIGGSLLLTSRVSVILHDAAKITAGLVLFRKGCLDFVVFPAVASVKGAFSLPSFSIPRLIFLPFVAIKNLTLTYLSLGKCYLRFIGGAISLGGSMKLVTSGNVKVPVVENFEDDDDEIQPQRHPIDRGIISIVKGAAYIFTKMLRYPASNHPRNIALTQRDRSFSPAEETPRRASPSRSSAEPVPSS